MDADLLVLGARGAGNMRHLLLGSTAERMLRKTLRPLLVVKQAPQDAYRRVLVPVDFSSWSAPALALAQAIAPQAELTLLHAFEAPFEGKLHYAGVESATIEHYRSVAKHDALHAMKRLAAEVGLDARAAHSTRVLHGDAARRILEQAQAPGCDLIVIGKHGESMLEELLLGSVTMRVLAESGCDVLVTGQGGGSFPRVARVIPRWRSPPGSTSPTPFQSRSRACCRNSGGGTRRWWRSCPAAGSSSASGRARSPKCWAASNCRA